MQVLDFYCNKLAEFEEAKSKVYESLWLYDLIVSSDKKI